MQDYVYLNVFTIMVLVEVPVPIQMHYLEEMVCKIKMNVVDRWAGA